MTKHWKAILGVFLIFVLGFVSGIVGSSIVVNRKMTAFLEHPAVAAEAAMEKRLLRNLDLDASQRQQIQAYFQDNLQHRKDLNQQIQPQVRTLNLQTFQQISAVLRPDQQEQFRKNIEKFRTRLGKAAASEQLQNLPPSATPPAPNH